MKNGVIGMVLMLILLLIGGKTGLFESSNYGVILFVMPFLFGLMVFALSYELHKQEVVA